MAVKLSGRAVKKEVIEDYLNQVPISDERVLDETPFFFKIRVIDKEQQIERDELLYKIKAEQDQHKKKELEKQLKFINLQIEKKQKVLFFEIKQLSIQDWQNLHNNLLLLERSMENIKEFEKIQINTPQLMENLIRLFLSFVTLENVELVVGNEVTNILDSDYALQLTDNDYKELFDELIKINFFGRKELEYLKKFPKMLVNKKFKKVILPMLKQNYEYTKSLAKHLVNYHTAKAIKDISFSSLSRLISVVIEYNNVKVKKNLKFLIERMMKATETAQNSKVSLSEKVTLTRTGKQMQLEIK